MVLTTFLMSPEAVCESAFIRHSGAGFVVTSKHQAQLPAVGFSFVGSKPEDIEGGHVAPEVLAPTKGYLRRPISNERGCSTPQNPIRLPSALSEERLAIELVDGPVRLLTFRTTVLEELLFSRGSGVGRVYLLRAADSSCNRIGRPSCKPCYLATNWRRWVETACWV